MISCLDRLICAACVQAIVRTGSQRPVTAGETLSGKSMNESTGNCPCGSGQAFENCCGPLLAGQRQAETAEQLMRSRYTAYTRADRDYLQRTWHVSTRPSDLQLDREAQPRWQGLRILNTRKGGPGNHEGNVEFEAFHETGQGVGTLHENSRFVKENGHWYYLDGDTAETTTAGNLKVGRNAPCPCGSGRKYKRCCGR